MVYLEKLSLVTKMYKQVDGYLQQHGSIFQMLGASSKHQPRQ